MICVLLMTLSAVKCSQNVFSKIWSHGQYGENKLMVLWMGGPLIINEKVYFNGDLLESVNGYKHLGLMMSPKLHLSIVIQTLRKQAEKVVLGIKLLGNKCGTHPKYIGFQMFDSKVLPILCYGSEMWSEN